MDNWEDSFNKWLADVQKNFDNFSENIDTDIDKTVEIANQEIDKLMEECEEYIEDISIEFNHALVETETFFNQFLHLLLDFDLDGDGDSRDYNIGNWEDWFPEHDEQPKPNPRKHPACVGCNNYHGYIYGGDLLVCAMHPYGWEGEKCPDWQAPN